MFRRAAMMPGFRLRSAAGGLIGVLIIAIAAVLSACSGGGGTATSGTQVTIALPEEPRTLASWNAYSNDAHPVLRNVQEALVNRDPKSNALVPELALSWKEVDPTNWQSPIRFA